MKTLDRGFYFEAGCFERWIEFSDIEDLASDFGDDRKAEEMDDETFYKYCEKLTDRS